MIRAAYALLVAFSFAAPTAARSQRAYPFELQLMPITQSIRRHEFTAGTDPRSETGVLRGVEGSVIGSAGLGLFGRYLTGDIGRSRKKMVTEGGVSVGDKSFKIEVGYSERLYLLVDSIVRYTRAGFSATTFLGTSGVAVGFRAGYYVSIDKLKGLPKTPEGWQGETSLSYTWDRLPLFAQVGYRIERTRRTGADEEMSALTLGGGLWLWLR